MSSLRTYHMAFAEWEHRLEVRAVFEAYRVWRSRWPWRWLPSGGRLDFYRARAFKRFGVRFREAFVFAWVHEYRQRVGFDPIGLQPEDLARLLGGSDRARRNLADRAEVELRELRQRRDVLRDPDDPECLAATAQAHHPAKLRNARELVRAEREAKDRVWRERGASMPNPTVPISHLLSGVSGRKRLEESHGHRR